MVIARRFIDDMVEQARRELPNEACGILASENDRVVAFYPIRNADQSPVHYTMEPQEQLRVMLDIDDRGWDLAAVYHSHTHTRAYPSPTDVRLAAYPGTLYIIVSLADPDSPDMRAYHIEDGTIDEVSLEVE